MGKAKITHWLLKVLRSPEHNPSVMRWEDEERGIFRVVDQAELGRMWGIAKNNPDMDYEKFRWVRSDFLVGFSLKRCFIPNL